MEFGDIKLCVEVLPRGVTGVTREAIVSVPVVVLADSGGLSVGDSCLSVVLVSQRVVWCFRLHDLHRYLDWHCDTL